jgi:cytochrome b involved in lipid metabolism
MKKAVAIVFVIVAVLMSGMLVWGFIDAQKKESDVENKVQDVPTTNENTEEAIQQEAKSINLSELSKHNKSNDCWVAIRGNVYDVTSYLDEHPGGADLILNYCGEDATSAYNNKGGEGRHSSKADSILNTYLLGNLN